jgi:hypothetical protein
MTRPAEKPWFEHEPVNVKAYPPDGAALPGTRTWVPICLFPENVACLEHLNDTQFRWLVRLLAACFCPRDQENRSAPWVRFRR